MMERDYVIGVGANLGDPRVTVREAIRLVATEGHLLAVSSLYRTKPWGIEDQPDFVNAVLRCESPREPIDMLDRLKALEVEMGREPGVRWGPRVVDLDILLAGRTVLSTERLTIPHPRLAERGFVLIPLAEIAPDLVHPVQGRTMEELARDLPEAERTAVTFLESYH